MWTLKNISSDLEKQFFKLLEKYFAKKKNKRKFGV